MGLCLGRKNREPLIIPPRQLRQKRRRQGRKNDTNSMPQQAASPAAPAAGTAEGVAAAAPRKQRGRHADAQTEGQDAEEVSIAWQLGEPPDVDDRRTPPPAISSSTTATGAGSNMSGACAALLQSFTELLERVGVGVLDRHRYGDLAKSFVQHVTSNNESAARLEVRQLRAASTWLPEDDDGTYSSGEEG